MVKDEGKRKGKYKEKTVKGEQEQVARKIVDVFRMGRLQPIVMGNNRKKNKKRKEGKTEKGEPGYE